MHSGGGGGGVAPQINNKKKKEKLEVSRGPEKSVEKNSPQRQNPYQEPTQGKEGPSHGCSSPSKKKLGRDGKLWDLKLKKRPQEGGVQNRPTINPYQHPTRSSDQPYASIKKLPFFFFPEKNCT